MAYCSNCGMELPVSTRNCPRCGYNMETGKIDHQYLETTGENGAARTNMNPEIQVTPYETGGLLAWSIITLLLCTIPGIVALVKTTGINSCATVEEQQKKIKSAKTWCIIGTILGCLCLLSAIGQMM